MTRARSSSRSRPAARRAQPGGGPFDPFTLLAKLLLRWQTFAVLAVAAVVAIALASWESVGGFLGEVQRALVRTFGAGLVFAAVGLIALSLALYFRRWPVTRRGLLRLAGGLALVIFLWGIAGWPTPRWTLGGVSLHEVTLGGEIGRFLGRTLTGLLLWFWCGVAAAAILAPGMSRRVLRRAPPTARAVYGWRIPQRIAGVIVEGTRALVSLKDDSPAPAAVTTAPPVALDEDDLEGTPAPVVRPPRAVRRPTVAEEDDEPAIRRHAGAGGWQHPPIDLLSPPVEADAIAPDTDQRAKLIVETLASFGVDARVVSVNRGPTVTQFGVEPGWEVKYRTVVDRDPAGRPALDKDGKAK